MHILASRLTFFCVLIKVCILERLSFLTAVRRLSITNYTDYYFSCNVAGKFIQWEYNNQTLSGFRMNEVGRVRMEERANYTYTATLLSSQPTFDNEAEMDSVLVISIHNGRIPGNFSVNCISNKNVSTAFPQHLSAVKNTAAKGANIRLDYVVSEQVRHGLSHIFMCGVRQVPLLVEVTGKFLSFNRFNNIGDAKTISLSDSDEFNVQAILMARDSSISVTLIIVSFNVSVVNVTCYDRENNTVRLPSVEVVSSDNQVVTVDGTMETLPADDTKGNMQTTEFLQTQTITNKFTKSIIVAPLVYNKKFLIVIGVLNFIDIIL